MNLAASVFGVPLLREFIVLCMIFVPVERLLARRREQRVFRRLWWSDLLYLFVNGIVVTIGLAAPIMAAGVLGQWLVPVGVRAAVANQSLWLQVVEALVIADLGFYAAHRMFHRVPWLWKFHAVHHSIEELDWLAGARVHPFDQIVTRATSVMPLYVLGFPEAALGTFSGIYFWQSFLVHSNVRLSFGPLRGWIASPEFHHWHHANHPEAYDRNFAGQLVILDRLFGTLYMPAGLAPARYGTNDPVPRTYVGHFFYPFKRRAHPSRDRTDGLASVAGMAARNAEGAVFRP